MHGIPMIFLGLNKVSQDLCHKNNSWSKNLKTQETKKRVVKDKNQEKVPTQSLGPLRQEKC